MTGPPGSIGLQAGAATAYVIVLFESSQAVDSLLSGKIELNGRLAADAGPTGWNRTIGGSHRASVDIYSQGKRGLYAGPDRRGGKIAGDKDSDAALYGANAAPASIGLSSRPIPHAH